MKKVLFLILLVLISSCKQEKQTNFSIQKTDIPVNNNGNISNVFMDIAVNEPLRAFKSVIESERHIITNNDKAYIIFDNDIKYDIVFHETNTLIIINLSDLDSQLTRFIKNNIQINFKISFVSNKNFNLISTNTASYPYLIKYTIGPPLLGECKFNNKKYHFSKDDYKSQWEIIKHK